MTTGLNDEVSNVNTLLRRSRMNVSSILLNPTADFNPTYLLSYQVTVDCKEIDKNVCSIAG